MKKVVSALLGICMVVSLIAGMGLTAFAEETQTAGAAEVWFCGEKLDSETPYLLIGKNSSGASVVKACEASTTSELTDVKTLAVFDGNNSSLTFKMGYSNPPRYDKWEPRIKLKQISDGTDDVFYGIYANGSLTVNLGSYSNVLFLDRQEPKAYAQEGIHINGDLTVNGDRGSMLRVTANPSGKQGGNLQSYGLNVSGKVTLNGGLIDVYENTYNYNGYCLGDNYATFIKANDIELNGGSLFLRGRKSAASPTAKKKLHEVGEGGSDAITVPASYTQEWAGTAEYVGGSTDADNYDKMVGNDINESFTAEKTEGDIYVKYIAPEGYKIKIVGLEIGGNKKYLVKDGESFKSSESAENAVAEYNIAVSADESGERICTRELKFLQDVSLKRSGAGIVYTVESESDLTVNTNGKNVSLIAAADWAWPVTRGNCIRAKGEIILTGGGILTAAIGADQTAEDLSSDKSVSAVVYSDIKIKIDDITATLYLGSERSGGVQANVLYAPEVEITDNANVKMAKNQPAAGSTPGYIIGGANSEDKISVAAVADAFLGSSRSQWGQDVVPSEKLTVYSYNAMKEATYMEVATRDKTVRIDLITVNDDNAVNADSNEVKFAVSPAGADVENAPSVFVVAAIYDENNKLISANTYSGEADSKEHILTLGGGNSIKVYVWNKSDILKPLKKIRAFYAAEAE